MGLSLMAGFSLVAQESAPGSLKAQVAEKVRTQPETEATTKVYAQKLAERLERQVKRHAILSVPAVEAWQDVKADGSSVTYRRIETPILQPQPQLASVAPLSSPAAADIESSVSASVADHRTVLLDIRIYPDGTSLVQWRHEDQIYPVWVNADLRYLEGMQSFEQNGLSLTLIASIGEASQTQKPQSHRRVAKGDFRIQGRRTPQALRQEVQALRDYYLANQQELQEQWRERKAVAQARADWEAANPEPPKEEVINFFKIR